MNTRNGSAARRTSLGCRYVLEIGGGEVIFRGGKLDVTLLVDVEQVAAVDVRAAPGWGKSPPHVHVRHGEALYVFEGELALQLEDRVHRVGPETWAFVPPGIVHEVEVTGDEPARFLVFHAPGSGYGDYIRGDIGAFDQRPAADAVSADPGLVVVQPSGGMEGDTITDRPGRRAAVLVETDEVTISEFHYGAGERGAQRHVHREHADAFLVLDGEFTFHFRDGSHALPAGTLLVMPPNVVHGFDNDSGGAARCFNFHMPSFGFADYMRGKNPDFDQFDPPEDGTDSGSAIVVSIPL
jgi:quercetin dioxygenase-like cupin family protein